MTDPRREILQYLAQAAPAPKGMQRVGRILGERVNPWRVVSSVLHPVVEGAETAVLRKLPAQDRVHSLIDRVIARVRNPSLARFYSDGFGDVTVPAAFFRDAMLMRHAVASGVDTLSVPEVRRQTKRGALWCH
jgi:hypothetical protein